MLSEEEQMSKSSVEAEAKLSSVAHVGRSRVIGAHMALGLIRGRKNSSKWKRGMGAEERVLLCDTVTGVSQVRNMAAGQSPPPHFHFLLPC